MKNKDSLVKKVSDNVNALNEFYYFQLLFSNEILDLLVEETNNFYKKQLLDKYGEDYKNIVLSERLTASYPYLYVTQGISKEDILAFIGIRIHMGIHKSPNYTYYWKRSEFKNIISTIMTKNYYLLLSKALHFPEEEKDNKRDDKENEKNKEDKEDKDDKEENNNNEENDENEDNKEKEEEGDEDGNGEGNDSSEENENEKSNQKGTVIDPRHKIQLYLEKLAQNFQKYYVLGQNITIDESLVHFKGRNCMKFYIPMKPYKWGFKIHLLVDSDTTYLYNMLLDPGRIGKDLIYYEGNNSLNESIVLRLLSCIKDQKKRNVFFDGWYSSLSLMKKLTKMGYLNTTVLRANSKEIASKLQSGSDKFKKDGILIQKYEGKRTILFATNYEIDKEELRNIYNIKNKGVDTFNHYMEISSIQRRTKKWYKKLLFFGIDASIINSKILCELRTGKSYTTVRFKEKIVDHIFKMYREYKNSKMYTLTPRQNERKVIVVKNECSKKKEKNDNKNNKSKIHNIGHVNGGKKKCLKCNEKTNYICNKCNVYLHPECFFDYHRKNIFNKEPNELEKLFSGEN